MIDRTTKLLLGVIGLALWGLLLRPVITPLTTHAQDGILVAGSSVTNPVFPPALVVNPANGGLYLAATDGNLYLFDANTLVLRARAVNTFHNESNQTAEQRARSFITLPPHSN